MAYEVGRNQVHHGIYGIACSNFICLLFTVKSVSPKSGCLGRGRVSVDPPISLSDVFHMFVLDVQEDKEYPNSTGNYSELSALPTAAGSKRLILEESDTRGFQGR